MRCFIAKARPAVVFALLLFTVSITANAQTRLAFGATNAQSSHYAYFAALAKVVNAQVEGVQASVVETGATVDNLKRMARNQLDIGLITTNTLYHAYNGQHGFAEQPIPSKLLWAYTLAPQLVIVRRDSGINSILELDGQRMGPGQRGSSTEATSELVAQALGFSPEWVRGSNSELANLIKDDRLNGFIKSAVGRVFDPLTTDIATLTPLRVLPLTPDQAQTIQTELPELSLVDMPANPDQERAEAFQTWGFMIGVSARPDLDDDIAYRITKAVMEDRTEQAAAFGPVKDVDLAKLTLEYATSPLHPGAIRYYEEAGHSVPDSLRD